MVVPKLVRYLGAASLILVIWLLFHTTATTRPIPEYGEPSWSDPNKNLIDEPPEPLQRVTGYNYDPKNPLSDRISATLLSLVRNEELNDMVQSMRDLERTFNHKFNYPWTFFNDVPFTDKFKRTVRMETKAEVSFEVIPKDHWRTPEWIDEDRYMDSVEKLKADDVQYADMISYHQMCRWNSGMFHHHPALANTKYYWRVEPNVHFFCDIDYDVFRFMEQHNKTYGFTINIYDSPASLPTLWPETEAFLAEEENSKYLHPNNAMGWITDAEHRPGHNIRAHGYSTCHFWSNFEIGNLDFWRSEAYNKYFDHLDRAGGFFYERWGDAPVHSIALGLFEDKDKIHWFRDIGYQHIPFFNCPNRPIGKCKGCKPGQFWDGEPYLQREDCRPSWFEHVGFGEWNKSEL